MTDLDQALRDARLAFEARDRDACAGVIGGLVRADAALGARWGAVGRLAATLGEVDLAIASARRLVDHDPDNLASALELGGVLASFGRVQEAAAWGEQLLRKAPNDPAVLHFYGTTVSQLGAFDAALEAFHRALKIRPSATETWLGLSTVKKFVANDADLARLRLVIARAHAAPPEAAANLYYALGKALDDIGDPAGSFDAFEAGAAKMRAIRPFDAKAGRAFVSDLQANFSDAFVRALEPSATTDDPSIFVLGLPRSGTTLMEQILAAHSGVAGGAELNLFMPTIMQLRGYTPAAIQSGLAAMPQATGYWSRSGRTYARLVGEWIRSPLRAVDKTLTNTRILGIILHTLPRARVIWMRRDPADNALSCFRLHVAGGLNWSWSLTDIAAFFKEEDVLFEHWRRLFPDRILAVPYEGLVRDPERWIPAALAHCGLPDEPGTRTFYEVQRAVQSASVAQVRRPLSTSSIGIADRVPDRMKPFRDAYG